MKPERRRELLLKNINKQLKEYLSAYEPTHKHYKRNIKNLYEGLTELGIIADIPTTQNFKSFKEAFHKASKNLKKGLIMAHILDDSDIGGYFEIGGKPINRLKMIANTFLAKNLQKGLSPQKMLTHKILKEEHKMLLKAKKDLKDFAKALEKELHKVLLKSGRKFLKDVKMPMKQVYKVNALINDYVAIAKSVIERKYGGTEEYERQMEALEQRLEPMYRWKEGQFHSPDPLNIHAQAESIMEQTENDMDELDEAIKGKYLKMSEFEVLTENIANNLTLSKSLNNERLNILSQQLEMFKHYVQDDLIGTTKAIPDVTRTHRDVIDLQKQLASFIQLLGDKRLSLRDPWKLMGYGSGGVDVRSKDAPDEATMLARREKEGFWMRDFSKINAEMIVYEKLINRYIERLPESQLRLTLESVSKDLHTLTVTFADTPKFFEHQRNIRNPDGSNNPIGRCEFTGIILNIEEHDETMEVYNKIKAKLNEVQHKTNTALTQAREFEDYQNQLILDTKAGKKSAREQLRALDNFKTKAARATDSLTAIEELKKPDQKEEMKKKALDNIYAKE